MNRWVGLGLTTLFVVGPAFLQAQAQEPSRSAQATSNQQSSPQTRRAARVEQRAKRRHVSKPVNLRRDAERKGFRKVSSLVNFPDFFPGLGALYVKPDTLPYGPFLAFDRKDRQVSTIFMIPMNDFQERKALDFSKLRQGGDHVTMHFNAGHPGVDIPHYHVVVWHVSKAQEKLVAR
jgi:hypothetical protein